MKQFKVLLLSLAFTGVIFILNGCGGGSSSTSTLKGDVKVDGSSTVFPITEAIMEEFMKANPEVHISAAESGTGSGFKKLIRGEIDIADASRTIKDDEEKQLTEAGIEYIELPIAYDGLAIVINPENTWVDHITVAELKKMWEPEAQGKITKWSQIRAGWPDETINLYGAGTASGTYDYFTEAIVGKAHSSRADYSASEDDNVLVQGVSGDKNSLGFFGLGYYENNKDKLKLVPVDDGDSTNGAAAVAPSQETVKNGTYQPLSRPLLIYVSKKSLENEAVKAFVAYYIDNAAALVESTGFIPLNKEAYDLVKARFEKGTTGSAFKGRSTVGLKIEDLMSTPQ